MSEELVAKLRSFYFNNAEEGRGASTRSVSASALREANELISQSAMAVAKSNTLIEEQAARIAELERERAEWKRAATDVDHSGGLVSSLPK